MTEITQGNGIVSPQERLTYKGNLEPVINRAAQAYSIGEVDSFKIIDLGYEDCNVLVQAGEKKYLAKMFAAIRTPEDIKRYTSIIRAVVDAGVHHPNLRKSQQGDVYADKTGISLVLLDFVEGKTFYEMQRAPDQIELTKVLEQAIKINSLNFKPPFLFDTWAVPNIENTYSKVRRFLNVEDSTLIDEVISKFNKIPLDELPHTFVHGDITKANTVLAADGGVYILDFSVANWYPRIQELAVITANLIHNPNSTRSLHEETTEVADLYTRLGGILTNEEKSYLEPYALVAIAMEFIGGNQEKYVKGNESIETDYWLELGRSGLHKALKNK